jgi:hypothetical protein
MSSHDRHLSDSLFESGFAEMDNGNYGEGLVLLRSAAGADRFTLGFEQGHEPYSPATGIGVTEQIKRAARGYLNEQGEYDRSLVESPRPDSAALVFMGAEAEFKGFIERRTGKSPDYRAKGFVNHLGQAIAFYRRAEELGYPVACWRLEALQLKMGSQDFRIAETSYNESAGRAIAYSNDTRNEILRKLGAQEPAKLPSKQAGCYIATAVYGSYDAPPVMTLRRFRDERLAGSPIGDGLIRLYYATSPRLAKMLTASSPATLVARRGLDAFVRFLEH